MTGVPPRALDDEQRFELFYEMSHELNLATTEQEIFRLVARYASRLVRADRTSICLRDDQDPSRYEIFALEGEIGSLPIGTRPLLTETSIGHVMQQRRLVVTRDLSSSAEFQDYAMLAKLGFTTVMQAPLITGGDVVGTINLSSRDPEGYTPRDERLLLQMAALLGATLKNRRLHGQVQRALDVAEAEHKKSDQLLLNILPLRIADRLKSGETMIADRVENAMVLFADIVGFTPLSARMPPRELVDLLNLVFSSFDHHLAPLGLEKIKTIGDAYMVVGGMNEPLERRPDAVVQMALAMQSALDAVCAGTNYGLRMRMGIHCGEVVAGIIGTRTIAYDLWGDTVNTASRMESTSHPGRIHCTNEVYELMKDRYRFESRGLVEIKGKGPMSTYFLLGPC